MHFIREAYEHRRNVELHLYRKVCLLVRLSVHVKSKKKVERTHLLVDQTCYRSWEHAVYTLNLRKGREIHGRAEGGGMRQ